MRQDILLTSPSRASSTPTQQLYCNHQRCEILYYILTWWTLDHSIRTNWALNEAGSPDPDKLVVTTGQWKKSDKTPPEGAKASANPDICA